MKPKYKHLFLDTNVLIYQTFEDLDETKHKICEKKINELNKKEVKLYISPQIIREFYAISTNSKILNNPLTPTLAIVKVNEFLDNFFIIYENSKTINILENLVLKYNIKKQKIHDTNIISTMLTHGIDHILTFNQKDFNPFDEINCIDLK